MQAQGSVSPPGALLPEAAQLTGQAMGQPPPNTLGWAPQCLPVLQGLAPPRGWGHMSIWAPGSRHQLSKVHPALGPVLVTEEVSSVTFPTVRLMLQA